MSKRQKTNHTGVFKRILNNGDIAFDICYKINKKLTWETVGKKSEGINAAIAHKVRNKRLLEIKNYGDILTLKNNLTINDLAHEYFDKAGKGDKTDRNRFELHIQPFVGKLRTNTLRKTDLDKIISHLRNLGRSPKTISNTLELLRRIINFGVANDLCPPAKVKITLPKVNNEKTEYLTEEQTRKLFEVLETWPYQDVARIVKLAFFTGMRRGEILKLEDRDLDFDQNLIHLRNPKGGRDEWIPMHSLTREVLTEQLLWRNNHYPDSQIVFPNRQGQHRKECRAVRRIFDAANIPRDFRPLHGLRHNLAVQALSSGALSLDEVGRLLTHKSPLITKRYAKFSKEACQKLADKAVNTLTEQGLTNETGERDEHGKPMLH